MTTLSMKSVRKGKIFSRQEGVTQNASFECLPAQ
jgi:hypothetical protein